ncbi:hypothetical protein LWI29_012245 [Acer saccharum]|uniref:F-box domain-containing protein n=1 Tax=Acer saccharum TaxID=4024 RepID=A0AA39W5C2_ACESA|nr:hypothetical protein LWI29_012245 [Acer saccharum]
MMNSGTLKEREDNKKFKGAGGRKKRTKNNVCNDPRSWADLSVDLLDIISNHLNLTEFLTFGKVCRNWRLFSLTFPQRRVLVFYISTKAKKSCYLFDLYKDIGYKTKLPNLAGNLCLGFSNGYLIMEDRLSNVWVINPITAHQIQFPPMPKLRMAALKLPNAASKSLKGHYVFWRSYFATFGPHGDFLVIILSGYHRDVRFCSSKDNNWKVYTFAYQSWNIVDIIVYNSRVFVVTNDCRIGVLNLGSSNLKFLKLKGTPHSSKKIMFVASNEQLLVINFKVISMPSQLDIQVYSIEFSTKEWVKVNNFGGKVLFVNDLTCLLSTNKTRLGKHNDYIYFLSSKNSHTCLLYSYESGKLVRPISFCTRTKRRYVPLICCWLFPNQFYSIKNVKEDDDDDQFYRCLIED